MERPQLKKKRPTTITHREKIFFTKPFIIQTPPTDPPAIPSSMPPSISPSMPPSIPPSMPPSISPSMSSSISPSITHLLPALQNPANINFRRISLRDEAVIINNVSSGARSLVKKESFKQIITQQDKHPQLLVESSSQRVRPAFRRQNTKPLLTEEDRERIREHAQKVIERENCGQILKRASSDSAIFVFSSEPEPGNQRRSKIQSVLTEKNKVLKKIITTKEPDMGKPVIEKKRNRSRFNPRLRRSISPHTADQLAVILPKRKITHRSLVLSSSSAATENCKTRTTTRNTLSAKSVPVSIPNSKEIQQQTEGLSDMAPLPSVKEPPKALLLKSRNFTDHRRSSRTKVKPQRHHIRVISCGDCVDDIRDLKSIEKSIILRKRRKLSITGENLEEFKENLENLANNSLISERITNQKGYIEKKICIKDQRMSWIL